MGVFDTAVPFFLTIALILLGAIPSINRLYRRMGRAISSWARETGLFADLDVSSELHRLDILRIILGTIVALHYGRELSSMLVHGSASDVTVLSVVVALSVSLAIGFLTPIVATVLLLVMNTILPGVTGTLSIGTMVVGMCLIPMVIAPAGHTLSVDALLVRFRAIGGIYRLWGMPTVDRVQMGRFLALLAFGAINLYSGLNHLGSETWRSGLSTGTILLFETSNRQYFEFFQKAYETAPWLYVSLSLFTTWGMLVWQILFVPLVLLSKWTRWATMIWAAFFFVASAHVLSIKMLGVYEYVLFALIFWSSWMIVPKRAIKVLFDDRCNLCGKTVKTIGALDVFRRVDFRPLSQNLAFANEHGVSEQEALTDLVGVDDNGKIYRGYDLYIRLSAIVLLLLPAWPILFLGKITRIGPMIYRFIADRRRRLFGVCELGTYRPRKDWAPISAPERPAVGPGVMAAFVILVVPFVTSLPHVKPMFGEAGRVFREAVGAPYSVFGVGPIDVFNELDLKIYRSSVRFSLLDSSAAETFVDMKLSEIEQSKMTLSLRIAALSDAYCSEDFAKAMMSHLDRTLSKDDPLRQLDGTSVFKVASRPNAADFYSFRYTPIEFNEVCRIFGKLDKTDLLNVVYASQQTK